MLEKEHCNNLVVRVSGFLMRRKRNWMEENSLPFFFFLPVFIPVKVFCWHQLCELYLSQSLCEISVYSVSACKLLLSWNLCEDSRTLFLWFLSKDSSLTSFSLPLSMFSLAVTLARVGVWGPAGAEQRPTEWLFVTELFFLISFYPKWMKCVGVVHWGCFLMICWWAVDIRPCSPPLHQHFQWAGVLWMLQHLHDEITFLIWVNLICWAPSWQQKVPLVIIQVFIRHI